MTRILVLGRHFSATILGCIALLQSSSAGIVATKWAGYWMTHRVNIVQMTLVNTVLTTTNEIVSRSISSKISSQSNNGFIVKESGRSGINRQSLINIWMTILASLLGGPVFFIRNIRKRFAFFVGFGVVSSAAAQYFAYLFRGGEIISTARLFFDLGYLVTVKFTMFELGRRAFIFTKYRLKQMSAIRVAQDFGSTFCRVLLLNLFGFKG